MAFGTTPVPLAGGDGAGDEAAGEGTVGGEPTAEKGMGPWGLGVVDFGLTPDEDA